jgi:hypothetical protein
MVDNSVHLGGGSPVFALGSQAVRSDHSSATAQLVRNRWRLAEQKDNVLVQWRRLIEANS